VPVVLHNFGVNFNSVALVLRDFDELDLGLPTEADLRQFEAYKIFLGDGLSFLESFNELSQPSGIILNLLILSWVDLLFLRL
jgi:hypothetical protein